jgi:hypothetical protein
MTERRGIPQQSLASGLFVDLGWCPILAQPWVKSDTNGFKEKMVPLMAKPMV